MRSLVVLALTLPILICGCALTTKADAVDVKYFAPPPPPVASALEATSAAVPSLRLGRVHSADHLRSAIVFQTSDVELDQYDSDFWSERPSDYVERALRADLFEKHRFAEALGGAGPTLDVEVIAFQEVRDGAARSARVTLAFELHARGVVLDSGRITADVPTDGGRHDLPSVVSAIGVALERVAGELVERTARDVASQPQEDAR